MNIVLKTTGIRGTAPKYQEKIGRVTAFLRHDQDYIAIDDYDGQGKYYAQRELTSIEVYKNGKLLFSGNKFELFDILEGK